MSDNALYRTVALSPAVSAANAFKVGASLFEIWTKRGPKLVRLGLEAWEPRRPGAEKAEREFTSELNGALHEAAEAYVDAVNKAIEDFETMTGTVQPKSRKRRGPNGNGENGQGGGGASATGRRTRAKTGSGKAGGRGAAAAKKPPGRGGAKGTTRSGAKARAPRSAKPGAGKGSTSRKK